MKTIQCLTVVVMMTVMVSTASLPKDELHDAALNMSKMNTTLDLYVTKTGPDGSIDELLKHIHDAALNMSKMNTRLDLSVTKIGQDGGPTCVHNFFCLAEKSLENATKKHQLQEDILIRLLKQFNSKTRCTHCQLNTTNEYELKEFLENVINCVDQGMINPPSLKCHQ